MFRRRWVFACLTVASFGTLLMCASPAIAVRVEPTPELLWKAFPLNRTGERLVKTTDPLVPPKTEALGEFVPASDKAPRRIVRPTLIVLLSAALLALSWLCLSVLRSPKGNEKGSDDRRFVFSYIGAIALTEVLFGYAMYTVVVLLV